MLAGTAVWVLRPGRKRNGAASGRNPMLSPNLERAGSISHPTSVPNFHVLPAGEATLTGASQGPSAHHELQPSRTPEQNGEVLPRRRRGKVAQLSKEVRDLVNLMLLDGVPYEEIISK